MWPVDIYSSAFLPSALRCERTVLVTLSTLELGDVAQIQGMRKGSIPAVAGRALPCIRVPEADRMLKDPIFWRHA